MSDEELRGQTDAFRATIAERVGTLRDELAAAREDWLQEPDAAIQDAAASVEVQRLDRELRKAEAEAMEELLPSAFAAVREAATRTIGLRHYDVQLIGGMVLHGGKIAEMKTGEGKTLVATLPLYLNALTGRGAHLVTPNDYLSKYGVQWMGPIYHLLGVSVGVIQSAAANPELGSFVFDPATWPRTTATATCAPSAAARRITPTSPTAPTTSSASTICATTWCRASTIAPSASWSTPSWMRWTTSSLTRRARR